MKTFLFLFGFIGGFTFGIVYLMWEAFKDAA